MRSAWINNGGIVLDARGVVLCDDCPCEEEPPGDPCDYCEGETPRRMAVTFGGVGPGGCGDCAFWNATSFIVPQTNYAPCVWEILEGTGPGCIGDYFIHIEILGLYVEVRVSGPGWSVIFLLSEINTQRNCRNLGSIPRFIVTGTPPCDWSSSTCSLAAAA